LLYQVGTVREELMAVLAKETCPKCRGQRYVKVQLPKGRSDFRKCPECAGTGYKIRKLSAC
jgi:DnaJ-class molecular chaperone